MAVQHSEAGSKGTRHGGGGRKEAPRRASGMGSLLARRDVGGARRGTASGASTAFRSSGVSDRSARPGHETGSPAPRPRRSCES